MQVGTEERRGPGVAALLASLDEDQRAAVTTPSTLVAVIAAAGSGKTRVLTRRIAHRVVTGTADARRTLALTFTREAAGELRRRLRRIGLREPVEAGTFHAVARNLLHQRWQDLGERPPAIVNDRARLLRELRTGIPVAALGTELDWAAARGIPPDRYVAAARAAGRRGPAPPNDIANAMHDYGDLKRRRGIVDLDDLLTLALRHLNHDQLWAEGVRFRYRHFLVDEAQDLNPVQFQLLRALLGGRDDVFLVGDPAQAIYAFNGSDPSLLAEIDRHMPGVEVLRLPVNHRSTPAVVDAGRHVLAVSGQPADTVASRDEGPPVEIHAAGDAEAEAALVARLAAGLDPSLVRTGQVGVLARTNAQLPALAAALDAAGLAVRRDAVVPGSPLAIAISATTALPSASRLRAWAHDVTEDMTSGAAGTVGASGAARRGSGALASAADATQDELQRDAERRVAAAVLEFLRDQPTGDGAALRQWIATTNPFASGPDISGVDVLTFHGAKGREWHTVFVTGVETSLVPHRSASTVAARAEEARLLHVALTRARDRLVVTWAQRRGGYARRLSPLLAEFDPAPAEPVAMPTELRRPNVRPERPEEERRRRLAQWRADAARAAYTLPAAICSDADLDAIAETPPADADELAARTTLGRLTAGRLFPGIRGALDA